MRRRDFLTFVAVALAATPVPAAPPAGAEPASRFAFADLVERARTLAAKAYSPPEETLPEALAALDYDGYRAIRFRPDKALWRDLPVAFRVQMFHRGLFFRRPVQLFEIRQGQAVPLAYDPAAFDFGPQAQVGPLPPDLGFAGFRVHHPLNTPDYFDELLVFLGASYFRAVGAGMRYGLSARGIAVDTASAKGEEFPAFTEFYLERPAPDDERLRLYALLEGPSLTGAYSFLVLPGEETVIDVDARLFTRRRIDKLGIAPLTSMFAFAANDRREVDDFRPAVHDSEGLQILTSAGEQIWRPLVNPERLRLSLFGDDSPRGFGLVQRTRTFTAYQDLEARYELRPSCWIEPQEDWGPGAVELIEIPSEDETNDNIVAFWRPREPVEAEQALRFAYRLRWCWQPVGNGLAEVAATRVGHGGLPGREAPAGARKFVVDFRGGPLETLGEAAPVRALLQARGGAVSEARVQPNPVTGGRRVFFDLLPGEDEAPVELRLSLALDEQPISETWAYQWTA